MPMYRLHKHCKLSYYSEEVGTVGIECLIIRSSQVAEHLILADTPDQ